MPWKAVEPYFLQMFPAFEKQYQGSGISEVYAKTLDKLPLASLKKAIDKHAAESHYAPRPAQLATTARLFAPTPKPTQTPETKEALVKEAEESWEQAADAIIKIGPGVAKAHRRTVLDTDWRVAHLKNKPIFSKAWMAILYPRIRDGLGPHQPSPGIPPCPSPKNSEKKDATSSDQVMSPHSSDSAPSKRP